MAKAKPSDDHESAQSPPSETAAPQPQERAAQRPREQRGGVPRSVRMVGAMDYSRARPRHKPVEVIRSWPGVRNGQLVVLHPAHQKRLLKGGFVKEVADA